MNKQKRFNQISRNIKEIKIQGARNIARKALYAYSLIPTRKSYKKLLSLRPTEPMLVNVLNKMQRQLSLWMLIAFLLSIPFALYFPELAIESKFIGNYFIDILKQFKI